MIGKFAHNFFKLTTPRVGGLEKTIFQNNVEFLGKKEELNRPNTNSESHFYTGKKVGFLSRYRTNYTKNLISKQMTMSTDLSVQHRAPAMVTSETDLGDLGAKRRQRSSSLVIGKGGARRRGKQR